MTEIATPNSHIFHMFLEMKNIMKYFATSNDQIFSMLHEKCFFLLVGMFRIFLFLKGIGYHDLPNFSFNICKMYITMGW